MALIRQAVAILQRSSRPTTDGLQNPEAQPRAPLGVDPKTVRRYISQGRLKAVRVGPRLIRIERESLESVGKPVGGAQ